jgi:hypothetical protein
MTAQSGCVARRRRRGVENPALSRIEDCEKSRSGSWQTPPGVLGLAKRLSGSHLRRIAGDYCKPPTGISGLLRLVRLRGAALRLGVPRVKSQFTLPETDLVQTAEDVPSQKTGIRDKDHDHDHDRRNSHPKMTVEGDRHWKLLRGNTFYRDW